MFYLFYEIISESVLSSEIECCDCKIGFIYPYITDNKHFGNTENANIILSHRNASGIM